MGVGQEISIFTFHNCLLLAVASEHQNLNIHVSIFKKPLFFAKFVKKKFHE